jgi:hypothetical protein
MDMSWAARGSAVRPSSVALHPRLGSLFKMMRETHGPTTTEVAELAEVDQA